MDTNKWYQLATMVAVMVLFIFFILVILKRKGKEKKEKKTLELAHALTAEYFSSHRNEYKKVADALVEATTLLPVTEWRTVTVGDRVFIIRRRNATDNINIYHIFCLKSDRKFFLFSKELRGYLESELGGMTPEIQFFYRDAMLDPVFSVEHHIRCAFSNKFGPTTICIPNMGELFCYNDPIDYFIKCIVRDIIDEEYARRDNVCELLSTMVKEGEFGPVTTVDTTIFYNENDRTYSVNPWNPLDKEGIKEYIRDAIAGAIPEAELEHAMKRSEILNSYVPAEIPKFQYIGKISLVDQVSI